MNERLEIEGDEREDLQRWLDEEAEREECNAGAPVLELTDDDLEAWYRDWCQRNGHEDPHA